MDCGKVGELISSRRREMKLTQKELADLLLISDKTVSKWERGLGCPDVSILSELSRTIGVDIEGILTGRLERNENVGGNMKKIRFYVCPECENTLTSTGEAVISCCGKRLEALQPLKATEEHGLKVEVVEDELYISSGHEMLKNHYITFAAFVTGDRLVMAKQYPEWGMGFRLKKMGHGKLFFYCSSHGLFYQQI